MTAADLASLEESTVGTEFAYVVSRLANTVRGIQSENARLKDEANLQKTIADKLLERCKHLEGINFRLQHCELNESRAHMNTLCIEIVIPEGVNPRIFQEDVRKLIGALDDLYRGGSGLQIERVEVWRSKP